MGDGDTDLKEGHRLGTINRLDPPEADWAAEYDWTRYRGPEAYPVPADWCLDEPESDAVGWYRFPDVGEGHALTDDVYDALGDDMEAVEEARGAMAILINEIVELDRIERTETVAHRLTIGGTDVFERVDPDADELFATVADALDQYADGTPAEDIDVSWESGRLTDEEREARKQARREEANQSLSAFQGGEADAE